jgi:hypothetical protein
MTMVRVRHGNAVLRQQLRGAGARAIERAEREIPCSRQSLVIEELSAGGYRIEGCGVVATYTCVRQLCVPDRMERSGAEGAVAGDASPPWSDREAREIARRVRDDLAPCAAAPVGMTVEVMPTGRVRRVSSAATLSELQLSCVDSHLERLQLGVRVSQTRRLDLELGPSAPAPAPPIAPSPGSADTAARAAVDRRGPAILACVDAPALALEVSWSAEGRLDALLREPHRGTPEEACVRAAVQALVIPAPGAPGTLVHAVQR